jgi:hypothetical protein
LWKKIHFDLKFLKFLLNHLHQLNHLFLMFLKSHQWKINLNLDLYHLYLLYQKFQPLKKFLK